jgi:hypothetical protein
VNWAIPKTANANEDGSVPVDSDGRPAAWCVYCSNEGVCMLEGSTTIGDTEYSRGSAPCPWCDQGQLRYAEWTAPSGTHKGADKAGGKHVTHHRRFEPASEFTMYDVAATEPEARSEVFRPTPEWCRERVEAGCSRAGVMAIVPRRCWPSEWTGSGDAVEGLRDTNEVARKRRLALEAKNQAEREGSP